MPKRIFWMGAIAGAVMALSALASPTLAAQTVNFDHPAYATVAGRTSIPVGHAEFCAANPAECGANGGYIDAMELNESRWQDLLAVNSGVNASVVPVTDEDLYSVAELWTYPQGYGDCEDFVLEKRAQLIRQGWAPSTLLITVVRQSDGEGHAVLMVRTDRGDLVLDNQDGMIRLWNETPYQFIKRQSQTNAGQWVDILDTRAQIVTASR